MVIVGMGAALGAGSGTFRLPPEYLFVGSINAEKVDAQCSNWAGPDTVTL